MDGEEVISGFVYFVRTMLVAILQQLLMNDSCAMPVGAMTVRWWFVFIFFGVTRFVHMHSHTTTATVLLSQHSTQ